MLYIKDKKETKKRRSYDYLHTNVTGEEVHRKVKIEGRVLLNGKPKLN